MAAGLETRGLASSSALFPGEAEASIHFLNGYGHGPASKEELEKEANDGSSVVVSAVLCFEEKLFWFNPSFG